MSGLQIHNAHPTLPFLVPTTFTLGEWLGGGLRWHFAAMWVLAGNLLVMLGYGMLSGRYRRKFMPVSLTDAIGDVLAALRGRLGHADLSVYNGVQRLLYAGVLMALVLVVLSGLAIWKPVQFRLITTLLGDFDRARLIHFLAMAAIAGFLLLHAAMALLVPRSLKAMLFGH